MNLNTDEGDETMSLRAFRHQAQPPKRESMVVQQTNAVRTLNGRNASNGIPIKKARKAVGDSALFQSLVTDGFIVVKGGRVMIVKKSAVKV